MKDNKLKSRKLWALIGSVVLAVLYPPSIPILKLLTPTYLGAQGAVDLVQALKG